MRATENTPIHTVSTAIEPPLSEAAAEAWIPRTCFKNGPPSRIGVELELVVADARHPDGLAAHYPRHRYPVLLRELAAGGLDGQLTVEPGGQVELSSRPADTLPNAIETTHRDLATLRRRAARCGARLVGIGVDPFRVPRRLSTLPRYVAMEGYLNSWGPAARTMMCSTASVQVNVEAGCDPGLPVGAGADRMNGDGASAGEVDPRGRFDHGDTGRAVPDRHGQQNSALPGAQSSAPPGTQPVSDVAARWHLLHAIGPALVAAFANSPLRAGRQTGWKSTRQAVWLDLDPARTGVPPVPAGEDPGAGWTRWALDAPLLLVRRAQGSWSAPAGASFRDWLRHGRAVVGDREPPTVDDLACHLTTLFPQVRARGHLEVRYLDAQPGHWWPVPVAVISAVLGDSTAASAARDVCAPTEGRWQDAARLGMADRQLCEAATGVLEIAAAALRSAPETARIAGQVEGFMERWTARGRCPADDPPDPGHADSSAFGSRTKGSLTDRFERGTAQFHTTATLGDEPS